VEDLTIGARTVNQLAYERLSALIFAGAVGPGERLDERLLAQRMGISRTPLREAIGQLASDGIVEHRSYQGNFVRTFTRKQVHDLYEVRKELEGLAVRLAAPNLHGDGIEELSDIVTRCRTALSDNDIEAFEQTDRDFHAVIVRRSNNETLMDSLGRLNLHVQLVRHLANSAPDLPEHTMHEREAILDAFKRDDPDAAAEIMRAHIQGVQDAVVGRLPEETSDQAAY
jgi:DNA-binding GntR family transcriptional regulator